MRLRSALALPFPLADGDGAAHAEIVRGSDALFGRLRPAPGAAPPPDDWQRQVPLAGGGWYLRWSNLVECLLSADARQIAYRPLPGGAAAAMETYLLGHVLSYVLLQHGEEPLHATAIVAGGGAVALMGDSGYGKSTLAAEFLRAGHRLLTDDLLVVRRDGAGFSAFPGPPRLKLFPPVAHALLGECASGAPMNALTSKLVIPLGRAGDPPPAPVSLAAMYVLVPPGPRPARAITIRRLSSRRAFVELSRATFNAMNVDRARLERQFALATALACGVPVSTLTYPRALARLPAVREAILADLAS
ncbi:MAG TPA: hypothetical protein VMR23_00835 [Candidatus Limnocylindria bacterium]|nr:hypothetical protein [Candidatus Limnocylindria bacterium]